MTAKHYINRDGTFAATYIDGVPEDSSLIEVPTAPPDGRMVYRNGKWEATVAMAREAAPAAIQAMMDVHARSRRYDGALSLSTYVNSTNPNWAAEATAFVAWRDSVWAYTYQQFALIELGLRPMPALDEFLAELPPLNWPPQ